MEKAIKYWKVEEGLDVFHDENGFCAYSVNVDEFFIAHCYVENRAKSYNFFNKMKDLARSKGATYMSGNLDLTEANKDGYTKKVRVHLGNGYKIVGVSGDRITVIYNL